MAIIRSVSRLSSMVLFGTLGVWGMNSCKQKVEDVALTEGAEKRYHLEIVDSIRLDYRGELEITDIDVMSGEILGFNFKTEELIIFDQSGEIHELYSRGGDNPHPINSPVSLGFYEEGKLLVANNFGKLSVFEKNGTHVKDIALPFTIEFHNWNQKKKIFKVSDDLLLGQISGGRSEEYREYYLDFIDLKNGNLNPVLPIPQSSKYKVDQYFGPLYPNVTRNDNFIYLLLGNEPVLYVYEIKGKTLSFVESVSFGSDKFVSAIPSESQKSFDWDSNYKEMRPGDVQFSDSFGNNIIVVYRNGIRNTEYNEELVNDPLKSREVNPYYIAVLDKEHNLVDKSVALPLEAKMIKAVMPDGKIMASKNKYYFGQEEDFETFYLLELIEE
ncbi:hypothetical protein IFO69_05935 [Echinicola sp. CAU 1574]|uniref:6-bladed beta-propeller n=1 Tax=Echinicola arenosa TaxID=2774144 RepID=A0ABR9AHF2_9BACT|nr:hypothetical protein [Echinicola arenosa]MBD8488280.1 hypothetical protein [Echinicola arenosa]